jgi:peptidoglycan/LPS O-acetylase OafA/YrhL
VHIARVRQVPNSYVKEIDALRCVAVMMVFIFHDRLLPFGWIGVWIFFVISGFSITTSLLPNTLSSSRRKRHGYRFRCRAG